MKLYTKSDCPQCVAVKRYLDNRGVKYEIVSADDDQARDFLIEQGYRGVPVLMTPKGNVQGFNPVALSEVL